ncbi:MAG: hypothetical protein NTY15_07575 [Planctomycetota bacterium]|nr:hypothetical protein [Planctomycetota bacterium]
MSKRKGHKKEVVRIDVDWLLGESPAQSVRTFPRFGSVFFSLVCVLVVVWSWPYASKQWLQWEWQQQLVDAKGKQTEEILPILLALNELNPGDNLTLIRQLADSDPNKRNFSFQILEKRIQQWGQKTRPSPTQWLAMVEAFQADNVQLPESIMLRGLLAQQLRPFVPSDLPDAPKVLASLDAMVDLITPRNLSAIVAANVPAHLVATPTASTPDTDSTAMNTESIRIRHSDSSELASIAPPSSDPPSLGPFATSFKHSDSTANQSAKIETSRQMLSDLSMPIPSPPIPSPPIPSPQLPNMKLSIPQTVAKAAAPTATVEIVEAPSSENDSYRSQQSNAISGIERRTLEQLLPLLTSAQNRIVQQAFNELVRRGMTPAQLDVAVSLAQGDIEQRLQSMETIAKDSNFPSPITWLVWMAENADRNVRRRAVVLLGSMTDSDARRKLRILQSKEPDSAIADQISQVLLASGTASISVR